MCQIIYKPKNAVWDMDRIAASHRHNPHGAGIAWREKGKIRIERGLVGMRQIREWCAATAGREAVLHMRLATAGKVVLDNCHPFKLPGGAAFFHNGHFMGFGDRKRSDTREFIEDIAAPYVRRYGLERLLTWLPVLADGNRIAIFPSDGPVHLLGGRSDSWYEGCWYSDPAMFRPYSREYEWDDWEYHVWEKYLRDNE